MDWREHWKVDDRSQRHFVARFRKVFTEASACYGSAFFVALCLLAALAAQPWRSMSRKTKWSRHIASGGSH